MIDSIEMKPDTQKYIDATTSRHELSDWIPIDKYDPELWQKNITALNENHPLLFEKIQSVIRSNTLVLRKHKNGFCDCAERKDGDVQIILSSDQIQSESKTLDKNLSMLSGPSLPTLIFLLGFDLGYSFDKFLPQFAKSSKKAAIVVEPDRRLFAAGLALHSFESVFPVNRVQWVIGEPIEKQLESVILKNHFIMLDRVETLFSTHAKQPHLAPVWKQARTASERASQTGRAILQQKIKDLLAYYAEKDPTQIRTIMAPLYREGKAVPYIQERFLDECRKLGLEVAYHQPAFLRGISFLHEVHQYKPDLLLCVNKSPTEFTIPNVLNQLKLPRMVWCIDDPNCFLSDRFYDHDFVFTWDPSYNQNLYDRQAQSVDWFPYIADLDQVEWEYDERFASPVSYIGQVKALNLDELALEKKYQPLIEAAGAQKANQPHRSYQSIVLEMQERFGLNVIESENDKLPRMLRYALYIVGNAKRRIQVLEQVMPFGLKFYGNEEWLKVLNGHPLLQCYQGPAHPEKDVPRIFVSSTINLNIHSLQAQSSLNQRDFNCPLVGGFLLTDWVDGADHFFTPDEELVFYRRLSELPQKIEYFLNHEEARQAVIQRGQQRVQRDHTYAARVPRVLETLKRRVQERVKGPKVQ